MNTCYMIGIQPVWVVFLFYQFWVLLFSWKKSNQKFKAASGSLLRILRSLSSVNSLRSNSTASGRSLRMLRLTLTRWGLSEEAMLPFGMADTTCYISICCCWLSVSAILRERFAFLSRPQRVNVREGERWSGRSICCLSEASSDATAESFTEAVKPVQPWSFVYFSIKGKVGEFISNISSFGGDGLNDMDWLF